MLHALATLETFRHLAAAGIDNELGLEASTIRHLARLDTASVQALASSDRGRYQHRSTARQRDRRDSGVMSEVEVNLDGKVPPRATFEPHETMFDASSKSHTGFGRIIDPLNLLIDQNRTPCRLYRKSNEPRSFRKSQGDPR